jgi:hypothetical protein
MRPRYLLRAALDGIVYYAAVRDSGQNPPVNGYRRNTAPPTRRPLRNGSATEDVVEGDGLEVAAVDDVE